MNKEATGITQKEIDKMRTKSYSFIGEDDISLISEMEYKFGVIEDALQDINELFKKLHKIIKERK